MIKVFFTICFLLLLYIVLKTTKSWFCLSRLNTLLWTSMMLLSFVMIKDVYITSVVWIFMACFFLYLGEILVTRILFDNKEHCLTNISIKSAGEINNKAYYMLFIIIVFGLIGCFCELNNYGYGISTFFSISKLLDMNNTVAVLRYSGYSVPTYITLLTTFKYLCTLCGGFCFVFAKNKKRIFLSVCSFLPSFISLLINNEKAALISSIILFFAGYSSGYFVRFGQLKRIKKKIWIALIILFFIFIGVLFASMLLRVGKLSASVVKDVTYKFSYYLIGQIESFGYWFKNIYPLDNEPEFGVNTFMGIFYYMGLVGRKSGVYDYVGNLESNVFTVFRGIITDYGIVGGVVFMFFLGVLSAVCCHVIYRDKKYIFPIVLYSSLIFFILYAFIISCWIYVSYYIVFILFYAFLILSLKKTGISLGCQTEEFLRVEYD